uniref:Putative amidohydrolase YtcJ n=1 Tax=Talaromyces marneffei PM1 TaxID=1077442 RepID=A0A093VBE1_TALMA
MVTYDLRGRFIMPGIHDAHVHLPSAGTSYLSSDWIVGGAFTIPNFDRISLDQDFPDTPIIIQGGAGHSAFLNTAGLIRAGYDVDNEPNAKGARFSRRADGSLTGELAELAMNKAMIAKGSPNVTYAKRAIKAAIRLLHQAGVTSCQEAATNTVIMHALRELDEENALHMNIAAHSVYGPEFLANEDQDSLRSLIEEAPSFATAHVHTIFVKIFA